MNSSSKTFKQLHKLKTAVLDLLRYRRFLCFACQFFAFCAAGYTDFDAELFDVLVEKITVTDRKTLKFHLHGGLTFTEEIV